MNIGKGLKRSALVAAIAVLAVSGASVAKATDNVSFLGHITASVTSLLSVTEVTPIKFGNLSMPCTPTCAGGDVITMTYAGARTLGANPDDVVLLNGASQGGIASGSNQETGSQAPGFYTISNGGEGAGTQNIYVTFANAAGNIIDGQHNNVATLTGPAGASGTFTVNAFSFQGDDGTTGYGNAANTGATLAGYGGTGGPEVGNYVTLTGGTASIRVGATMTTTAGSFPPGQYNGEFQIMVSY